MIMCTWMLLFFPAPRPLLVNATTRIRTRMTVPRGWMSLYVFVLQPQRGDVFLGLLIAFEHNEHRACGRIRCRAW